ncbi:multiple C2 and transmembrane domain-containing protein [Pieris rapae]|uniref:multiple C2 and transmembrane domain-containing protein n=1 Tax=Pieris rapae TaxID=64459 RepID=UPI001E2806B0|nr:multiple C2 and transmembrane domain-containing protein [Pieris rapae]
MEIEKHGRKEKDSIQSRHISKLHERVQTKYCEMQKKLEKAKSADLLACVNEDHTTLVPLNANILQQDKSHNFIATQKTVKVDDARENDSTSREIVYDEATISGSNTVPIVELLINDDNNIKKSENALLFDLSIKGSVESLAEVKDDALSDDSIEPSSAAPKSIRSRIRLRIREARKRKQEREKEKNDKNKRRNSYSNVEKLILSNTPKKDVTTRVTKKTKIATVTIALIEVVGFNVLEEEKPRYVGCRIRLGSEKRKSKIIKTNEPKVMFKELYHFNLYEDEHTLEIVVWDKDVNVGRHTIDLSRIEKEKTKKIQVPLDDSEIQIFYLLTISGISDINTVYNMYENVGEEAKNMRRKYKWYRLCDTSDVGWLNIIVYGAKGLTGNDCYCVLSLNNERVFTATDNKTNAPSWMKVFHFQVTDITSILEITVYDEKKGEEVGNISIPLLNIESGKKWYALKESTQRERAKGNNPRILLEMEMSWNLIKASLKVITPKEVNLMESDEKLDRHLLARNIARGRTIIMWVVDALRILKSCFEWQSRKANIISLICWLLFCYFFKTWMLPLLLLLPFFIYRPRTNGKKLLTKEEENILKEKEDKSLRQRIQDFQETIQTIQNFVGKVASLGESIKNLYNFSVPFVSFLAIFLISIIACIMFLIPLQYILMVWGIHKFTRKILKPNRVPHSEILDLLSRVPDDITLSNCQEIPLEEISDDNEF